MGDVKGRRVEGAIRLGAVRWRCKHGVSCRELEEVLEERGVLVDRATTRRWTQRHAPGIERPLCRRRPRSTGWRMDEADVKARGRWACLHRAIDERGDTLDVPLSPTRSAKAATRVLAKAMRGLKAAG